MVQTLEMYILIFFTYSFLGWMMESVGGILNVKKFVNRGFLIGPYCPVYGTGVVLITLLLNKYVNDIPALFFLSTLICGVLEYATSFFMEKFFNARWWDYSKRKFNINGRICLETLIPFGIAGTLIMCVFNPILVGLYSNLSSILLKIIAYGLATIFLIDMIISFKIIMSFKKETYKQEDNTEEISDMVKDKAEDLLMKAGSDAIVFSRRLKLKEIRLERKLRYTGKQFYSTVKMSKKEFAEKVLEARKDMNKKIQENKEKINEKLKETKENLEQKISKETIEQKLENIKVSSEEFTKQVRESFKNKSLLKNRLMEAFPELKVKEKISNNKKKK